MKIVVQNGATYFFVQNGCMKRAGRHTGGGLSAVLRQAKNSIHQTVIAICQILVKMQENVLRPQLDSTSSPCIYPCFVMLPKQH